MKPDIVRFLKKYCPKYKMGAFYFAGNDAYIVHYKGKIVAGFTSENFYDLPKGYRIRDFRRGAYGLASNLGERYYQQTQTKYKAFKKIV